MSIGLRFEDRLDGASNFNRWKERMALILGVNDLCEFSSTTVTPPTNAAPLVTHKSNDDDYEDETVAILEKLE